MSRTLLFEIGTEELPASYAAGAIDAMPGLLRDALEAHRLTFGEVEAHGTPRRLAVVAHGLADRQADVAELVMGPPKAAAFEEDGTPKGAAIGFAKKLGIDVGALTIEKTDKGEYVAGRREEKGQPAEVVLPTILAELVGKIPFRKSMRWGEGEHAFGRPIHWLVCLLDDRVIEVGAAGVTAGRTTRGHRFLAPESFELARAEDYVSRLREARVLADVEERTRVMSERLDAAAKDAGGVRVPNALLDAENLGMVEEPHVICGRFDEAFLSIPADVTIAVMAGHQRYYALRDARGSLLPRYLAVVNTDRAPDEIARGNDRVLRARLADARFFVETDKKTGLDAMADKLGAVVFQAKLGTVGERAERLAKLAATMVPGDAGQRAARLCKADLVSLIVGEFPELQGSMGRWYAERAGEPAEVALAIEEHYQPRGAFTELPGSPLGIALALADRADLLVGCFGLGQTPSGSADPFGLRRAALGIVRIATETVLPFVLDLRALLENAYDAYEGKLPADKKASTLDELVEFFRGRLRAHYGTKYPGDAIHAGLAAWPARDLADAEARVEIAAQVLADEWGQFREAFKRTYNIAKDAPEGDFDPGLATEDAERALAEAWRGMREDVDVNVAHGHYRVAMHLVGDLRDPIHTFFEKVFVMVDDPKVRENRLRLLASIARTLTAIAHFHLLGG
ncbi:MAG: glycine--tRNA ligase subunit beta [Sandaracinaceae bacterium]